MFWLGALLFALGIFVSVCLHEFGHMLTAKAFGMKVTQYFAGFGPTVWSFRRGETEYGLKAIPAGGFVKIVGMTPLEHVPASDEPRSFWRAPLWQRTVVLSAGSITHFLLAVLVAFIAALTTGLPNIQGYERFEVRTAAPIIEVAECVAPAGATGCSPGDPAPARVAGFADGDRILSVAGTPVTDYGSLIEVLQGTPAAATPVVVQRGAEQVTLSVTPTTVERLVGEGDQATKKQVSAIGVSLSDAAFPAETLTYGPVEAVGATTSFFGETLVRTFEALKRFPERIPKLVDAIRGEERDPETPISVYGASVIGGDALESDRAYVFLVVFVGLNVFIGIFNLLPLLPLDGGHIAIAWFERARSSLAARRGRPDPGRVDYDKLMPLTYAVILVFGAVTLLTLTADIVNPIRLS